jgi:hypothetical protein
MDDTLQQILALSAVAVIVGIELRRRWIKKRSGKIGCDGCATDKPAAKREAPIKFYKHVDSESDD